MARKKISDKIHAADEDTDKQISVQTNNVAMEYLGAQIPKVLGGRLRRGALTQKENGQRPWIIKEIVAEAVAEWCEKRGY